VISLDRITAKVHALSARERFLLLSCAVFVLGFVLVQWIVVPAVGEYRKTRSAIPLRRAALSQSMATALGREDVLGMLAEAADLLSDREEGLLPGETPSEAGIALQGILKPWVTHPETRVTSVRTLAPSPSGPYTEVAVQMDLQTSMDGLAMFLSDVVRYPKILGVRKLSVSSGVYSAALGNRRETLKVSVVISGLTKAGEEGKEGGGGR